MENQESSKFRNPTDYLKVIFRRKWYFIVPAYIGLVAGIIACFIMPRTYLSSTIILVEEEKIINPIFQNLAISTTALQRMQNIRETLLGWNSLVELTKKLNLAKNVQTQPQFENLILTLRRNIHVRMRPNSNIIEIGYFGKEPQEAQLVARTLGQLLVEKNLESQTKETDVAINFIKEQLAIYKRKIKESEISELEEQLKALLADSTEQHPLVKELRQKVAIATKELESGEYQITTSEQPLNNATRETLKKELDNIINKESAAALSGSTAYASETETDPNQAIYKLFLMDRVDSVMARDIDVNEAIYNMLLQKLETAKITQRLEVSKEGTRYTIIDPARLPFKAVKPNKFLVVLLGLTLGGVSGAGLVFGREFMDHSFLDIEDAKEALAMPVLGAISRLTTQEEIAKERYLKKKFIAISISSSVVVLITVMLYSFFKG